MSEHITWICCPLCGARAAVGWRRRHTRGVTTLRWDVAEFDCREGCTLTDLQVLCWFGRNTANEDLPDRGGVTPYGPWSGWWRAADRPSSDQRASADR